MMHIFLLIKCKNTYLLCTSLFFKKFGSNLNETASSVKASYECQNQTHFLVLRTEGDKCLRDATQRADSTERYLPLPAS